MNKIKNIRQNQYLLYSILFIITSGLVFSVFIVNHRSFVWYGSAGDGLTEHYNAFVYFGSYLRTILNNIFVNHTFTIPLWDPSIGFGSDIITTLNCYILGDPLGLLAVFFGPSTSEFGYNLLVIIRLFLSGITFLYYCRSMKLDEKGTIVGALVYVFSGFGLYASVKHPYFINSMIYFPLILVGIEKVFNKKSPILFITMIFISALSNFYFFYMLSLLMFIYAVFRYFMLFKKIIFKDLFLYLSKFIFYYFIGLALASFTFLPSALSILNSTRVGMENYIPLFYTQKYYWNLFSSVIASGSASYWSVLSFSYIGLLSTVVLFTEKKNYALKIAIILLSIFICIPWFGHLFNGLSYFTNRYIWGLSFLVALISAIFVPKLSTLNKKQKMIIILFEILYLILYLFNPLGTSKDVFVPIAILFLSTIAIFIIKSKRIMNIFIICSVIFSIFVNGYYRYSKSNGGYVNQFISSGYAYDAMANNSSNVLNDLDDDGYYRFDQNGKYDEEPFNTTMISKEKGTAFYFSTINGDITKFLYDDLFYTGNRTEIKYSGLDSRTFLDALFNVKYYVIDENKKSYLPYGFNNVVKSKKNLVGKYDTKKSVLPQFNNEKTWNAVYNDYYVPFGYTYESYMTEEEYNELPVEKKQEALMQSVILSSDIKTALSKQNNEYTSEKVNYKITNVKGMKQKGNSFELTDEIGTIELAFEDVKDSELYLILKDVSIDEREPLKMFQNNNAYWSKLNEKEKEKLKENLKFYQTDGRYFVKVKSGDVSKSLGIFTPKAESYSGFNNFLVNLGYSEENRNKITLTFKQAGKYNLDNIEIVSQKMTNYGKYVSDLKENHLENVLVKNNTISGNISVDKEKMLCLSIPYSKSWRAYVDGKEVDLNKVNSFMSGLELKKGNHSIKLEYTMPYKFEIAVLTSFGLIGFISVLYIYRKKNVNK